MNCSHCQMTVTKNISSVKGVKQVDVNLSTGIATVEGKHKADDIVAAVRKAGFDVVWYIFITGLSNKSQNRNYYVKGYSDNCKLVKIKLFLNSLCIFYVLFDSYIYSKWWNWNTIIKLCTERANRIWFSLQGTNSSRTKYSY